MASQSSLPTSDFGMRPPRLPLELCYAIIDNVDNLDERDHETTLRACSLTCRAFLPASRRRLFHRVFLYNASKADLFLNIICSAPVSTNPCSYVRCLRLDDYQPRWVSKALPLLTTCLLEVTSLELRHVDRSTLDDMATTYGFQKVERLRIFFRAINPLEQLSQFLATFPALTSLSVGGRFSTIDETPVPLP